MRKTCSKNFSFAFSTGDIIDTLEVSGVLLNAENLEPMPGITIGPAQQFGRFRIRETPVRPYFPYE